MHCERGFDWYITHDITPHCLEITYFDLDTMLLGLDVTWWCTWWCCGMRVVHCPNLLSWVFDDGDDLAPWGWGWPSLWRISQPTSPSWRDVGGFIIVILDVIGHFGGWPRPIHLVNLILDPYFVELVRKTIWFSFIKRQIVFHFRS